MVADCYTDADDADFFPQKCQNLYTSVPFTAIDMEVILSKLSAYIHDVREECIFSCNEDLKAANKLKLHKADELKYYFLMISKNLVVISMSMSHFCCRAC